MQRRGEFRIHDSEKLRRGAGARVTETHHQPNKTDYPGKSLEKGLSSPMKGHFWDPFREGVPQPDYINGGETRRYPFRNTEDTIAGYGTPLTWHESPELQLYDPWGKGGAGAPLLDDKGNVITHVHGKLQSERASGDQRQKMLAAQEYREELQHGMVEQRIKRDNESKLFHAESGELADIIKKGQVGRPIRDHRGILVTMHSETPGVTNSDGQWNSANSREYLGGLEMQVEVSNRERLKQLDKLRDRQEAKYHQQTMGDFWGRPGAGAPNTTGIKRTTELENMINSPRVTTYYNKQYETDIPPEYVHSYVRSTINSTHFNGYENPRELRREPKKDYNLETPWASETEHELDK